MELNDSIYSFLSSVSALTTLTSTRIYPDQQTQKNGYTYPYVTYSMVSEIEVDTIKEQTNMLISSAYQFDVWAATRTSAKAVAKQIRKAFKDKKGVLGTNGVTVSAIEKINATSDLETNTEGKVIAYREMLEFQIWHYETN